MKLQDQIIGMEDVSLRYVDQAKAAASTVPIQPLQRQTDISERIVPPAVQTVQDAGHLAQGKCTHQKEVSRVLEKLIDQFTACFMVVPLRQGAGIEDVEHAWLLGFPHSGDLFRQTPLEFGQSSTDFGQGRGFFSQQPSGDILVAREDRDSCSPQCSNGQTRFSGSGHGFLPLIPEYT